MCPRSVVEKDLKPGLTNPGAWAPKHYSTFQPRERMKSLGEEAPQKVLGARGPFLLPFPFSLSAALCLFHLVPGVDSFLWFVLTLVTHWGQLIRLDRLETYRLWWWQLGPQGGKLISLSAKSHLSCALSAFQISRGLSETIHTHHC